jgi:hypothetical protein
VTLSSTLSDVSPQASVLTSTAATASPAVTPSGTVVVKTPVPSALVVPCDVTTWMLGMLSVNVTSASGSGFSSGSVTSTVSVIRSGNWSTLKPCGAMVSSAVSFPSPRTTVMIRVSTLPPGSVTVSPIVLVPLPSATSTRNLPSPSAVASTDVFVTPFLAMIVERAWVFPATVTRSPLIV